MNNKVALAASFLFGVGTGAAGCYIFLKKKLEKESEEEIKKFKKDYISAKQQKSSTAKKEDIKVKKEPELTNLKTKGEDIPQLNYAGFFTSEEDVDDQIDQLEEEKAEAESPTDDEPEKETDPYILSEEELEEELFQDCIAVTYFMDDGELMDDMTRMTVDISEAFGDSVLKKIIEGTQNNVYDIFVKNPKTDSIYEVTIDDGSYKDYMRDYYGA